MSLARAARELASLILPEACAGCMDALPPGMEAPVCLRCRTLLKALPGPPCPRCSAPLGTATPLRGPRRERGGAAESDVRLPVTEVSESCRECAEWSDDLATSCSAVLMRPPADALVHGLKYRGWSTLSDFMAARIVRDGLHPTVGRGDAVVVPVPTTQGRFRVRGYNQAALIAGSVARRLDRPMRDVLERAGEGPTQVSLPPDQRLANVKNAFSPKAGEGARVAGKEVLLVDDVLTTGATALEAATTLRRVGARAVHLSTFARALPT